MFADIIPCKINRKVYRVLVFLYDTNEDNKEVVRIQTMVNEYYCVEDVEFPNRDSAYSFINRFSEDAAKDFVWRAGAEYM